MNERTRVLASTYECKRCGANHQTKENDNEDSACADEPDDEVDRELLSPCLTE